MIVDIVDKYCTDDNNPIKNLRLNQRQKKIDSGEEGRYLFCLCCSVTVVRAKGADPPPPLNGAKAGRNHLNKLKVGTNENGSACGRWLSIGI